jgi:drug/metabolite transporter (DMT)-like permease
MLRQLSSITLLVSLIALGISGLLMLFLGSMEFQLQMHPIHKIFGVLMCVAGAVHACLNFKAITHYLKNRKVLISGVVLVVLMILLFVAGMNKPLNPEAIEAVEQAMLQVEG